MHKASAIPSDRLAQDFPTSRVLTVFTVRDDPDIRLLSSIEPFASIPSTHRLGGLNSLGEMHPLLDVWLLELPGVGCDQRVVERHLVHRAVVDTVLRMKE